MDVGADFFHACSQPDEEIVVQIGVIVSFVGDPV